MTYVESNSAVKGRSSVWSALTRQSSQKRHHLHNRYWCFWIVGALIPFTLLRMVYLSDYNSMKGQSSVLDLAASMMESSPTHRSRHIDEAASSTFLERNSEGDNQMKTQVQEFLKGNERKEAEHSLEVIDEESVRLPEKIANIESEALANGDNQDGKQEKKQEKEEEKHRDGEQEKEEEKHQDGKQEKLGEKHHEGKHEKKDEKLEEKHHEGKHEEKDEKLEEKHQDGKQEKKDEKLEEKRQDEKQEKKDEKLEEKRQEGKQEKNAERLVKHAGEQANAAEERHTQQEEPSREEATHAHEKELITNESEGDGQVEQMQGESDKGVDERGQVETVEENGDRREAEQGEQNQVTEEVKLDETHEDGVSVTQEGMDSTGGIQTEEAKPSGKCDLFEGEWVWDPEGPLYTNSTCFYMQGTQNCMGNGRPDTNYLHWRWKPRDCDLPRFDARSFLEAFRGKTIGFVGDSLARNQMQSLLCMLSQVQVPRLTYQSDDDSTVRWLYEEHQVTLAVVWSPYLLKESHDGIFGFEKGQSVLYLDVLDPAWTSVMQDLDIIVLSIGQWYFKGSIYVAEDAVVGCHYCPGFNLTEIGFFDPYRDAVRQVLEKVASEFKGIAIMSTFAISHFEDGPYSDGGQCKREDPLSKEEGVTFPGMHNEMHDIVMSEFNKIAYDKSKLNENVNLEFLDVTKVSLTRADGHPGAYRKKHPYLGRNPDEWVQSDCLHWCLPGPVDTWNQLVVKIVNDVYASSQNNFVLSESG